MRRSDKRIILGLLAIILIVLIAFVAINRKNIIPFLFPEKKNPIPQVFGKPNYKTEIKFASNSATIEGIKSSSKSIQRISIVDKNKAGIFQRAFYADAFLGSILTYSIATNTGEITQTGSLGSIGCKLNQCNIMWTNFYKLTNNSYALDNASHKDFFKSLLISYQVMDNRGCNVLGSNIIPAHNNMSFSDLYAKYPSIPFYCSQEMGILPENLQLFLKAKKAVQEVINGNNISSEDINNISL